MKALLYVTKRSCINEIKRKLKKPLTYVIAVFIISYMVMVLLGWNNLMQDIKLDSVFGFIVLITIATFYLSLPGYITYAKKRGIIFKQSHAHFIFTSPIPPKLVLLYTASRSFLTSFLFQILITICGVVIFQIPIFKMLLYFLIAAIVETVLDGCIILFLYANEKIKEKKILFCSKILWGIILTSIAFLIIYFMHYGLSLETAESLVNSPVLQLLPLLGWQISVYRFILLGPTLINSIGSILYLFTVIGMFLVVKKMKCTGNYYEDAAKFADDYSEIINKSKNGEGTIAVVGKKKKFKKATISYKTTKAGAVFYRQILEYKKEKFFIFGFTTIISIGIAVACTIATNKLPEEVPPIALLAGILAYLILLTSGYTGKWEKELSHPSIYLIPDTPFKKLWNATLMEHVKALIDGCIIVIPIGIAWKIEAVQCALLIGIYVVLQANKLYAKVFVNVILGASATQIAKSIVHSVVQMLFLGIGIAAAVVVGIFIDYRWSTVLIFVYGIFATILMMLFASLHFQRMEQTD